ncbi:HNH endonuclease signature motif containing protein [soil metagenome]
MGSAPACDRDWVLSVVAGVEAAVDALAGMSFDGLSSPDVVAVLARLEAVSRRQPAITHQLIGHMVRNGSAKELGATNFTDVLSTALRIGGGEAKRRIDEAATLGERTALTGEPLPPLLPHVAAGQAAGRIGAEHIGIIRGFFKHLPVWVGRPTRELAEAQLAQVAGEFGPEELRKAAALIAALVNPDGEFSDADRARKRDFTIGRQGPDGMSTISGQVTPELRATLEAVFSKWAAPGMGNPDDETSGAKGKPSEAQVKRDRRTRGQRQHDALPAMGRNTLCSGELGSHHGLPVTIVISTTLKELESGAGIAVTSGGTRMPMTDLVRLASHAFHYLVIFDEMGRALDLGRTKRIASADQRIVLHAKDRGCTFPGCTVPGFLTEVHHAECDWGDDGLTNINDLTLACGPHNRLVKPGGWRTRKRKDGRTEWIPPPDLDTGRGRTNKYHHPEELLRPEEERRDEGDEPN